MTERTPARDKLRINPQIPSELYTRLSLHVGTKPGALSQFCERAIEAELQRYASLDQ